MPVQQFGELLSQPQILRRHIIKILLASFIASILAALIFDQRLSTYFSQMEHAGLRSYFRTLTDIGLSEYYFAAGLLAWIAGRWVAPLLKLQQPAWDFIRRWGLNLLAALILSGLLVHITKFFVGRQRPHKSPVLDPFVFDPLTTHWHWHSFASGHSQVIFTAATLFSVAFPRARWFFFAFAVLICFSRIVVLDHFFSDTIMGAALGYCGALLAMRLMMRKTRNGLFPRSLI